MATLPRPQSGPLYDAIVDNAIAREDQTDAAVARVAELHPKAAAVRALGSTSQIREAVLRAGITASAAGIKKQRRVIAQELSTETTALQKQNPKSVKPLTDADLAARRAEKIDDGKGAGESGGR